MFFLAGFKVEIWLGLAKKKALVRETWMNPAKTVDFSSVKANPASKKCSVYKTKRFIVSIKCCNKFSILPKELRLTKELRRLTKICPKP